LLLTGLTAGTNGLSQHFIFWRNKLLVLTAIAVATLEDGTGTRKHTRYSFALRLAM